VLVIQNHATDYTSTVPLSFGLRTAG